MAGLITRSKIKVLEFDPEHISSVIDTLKLMGAKLEIGDNFVKVLESKLSATNMSTAPYPGFPTDAPGSNDDIDVQRGGGKFC